MHRSTIKLLLIVSIIISSKASKICEYEKLAKKAYCYGFKSIPQNLANSIRTLNADNNEIPILYDNSFVRYPHIEELFLRRCDVNIIEKHALKPLEKLKILHLYDNNLSDLPDVMLTLPYLRELRLNKNHLTEDSFDHAIITSPIEYLDLGFNNISSVPDFKSLQRVKKLDLSRNNINTVTVNDIASFCLLETLYLNDNPLSFENKDCECIGLRRWIDEFGIEIYGELDCRKNNVCPNTDVFSKVALKLRNKCLKSSVYLRRKSKLMEIYDYVMERTRLLDVIKINAEIMVQF